jgi:hypothetical protein
MTGQLDQSRRRAGIEWLVEKGSEDVSATVMLPEDHPPSRKEVRMSRSALRRPDDFAARRGWGAEAPVVRRTRCTACKGDQQQRAPTPPRGSGMVPGTGLRKASPGRAPAMISAVRSMAPLPWACPFAAKHCRASVCASSRDIRADHPAFLKATRPRPGTEAISHKRGPRSCRWPTTDREGLEPCESLVKGQGPITHRKAGAEMRRKEWRRWRPISRRRSWISRARLSGGGSIGHCYAPGLRALTLGFDDTPARP